jgi:glycosyltransferase involved in cell wall biosynthesis
VKSGAAPLVSVLIAVHDGARYLKPSLASVLRQTVADFDLLVVDDGSTDATPELLAAISDPRLRVVTNDAQAGLAASLNSGLEQAQGRYVARLDADDVAFPEWLERLLTRIRSRPEVAVVGTGIVEVDAAGRPGDVHRLPVGPAAVSWHALFSAPFFHSTVVIDRDLLDRRHLRYDEAYGESEDYELWTRLLAFADGDNIAAPLVLRRMHAEQAQARRGELQRSLQRDVALREIARLLPDPGEAEQAWRFGVGEGGEPGAYLSLLERFEERHGVDPAVREAAAKRLARAGRVRRAVRLAPTLPARVGADRVRRPLRTRAVRRRATEWLAALDAPVREIRVAVVSPEPTPYRSPLFDRIAARRDIDLTVIYAARTVARRAWSVEPHHRSVFLRGVGVPGARRLLRHDYPVTPGIVRALRKARPQVVVVSGWSTFAAQTAISWCRARNVPYVLLVESHDLGRRSAWRRAVKRAVVPRLLRAAAGVLVVGTLARDSVVARGAPPERIRVFANTIDVAAWEERADRLARRRRKLRSALAFGDDDVVVLSVARLAPEKGLDTLVRAVAATGDPGLAVVVAGSGPRASTLMASAEALGVRLLLTGELAEERVAEAYVAADVFALLSTHEPWGVVVNEAAASGLPLVLSDRVGAAPDLVRDNGATVAAGDVAAAADLLGQLAADPDRRRAMGERSRELVLGWGYEPSVESFVAAVREAAGPGAS